MKYVLILNTILIVVTITLLMITKKAVNLVIQDLKIKTLSTKPANPKLIAYLQDSGVTTTSIAGCLNISESWLSAIIHHKKLDKRNVNTIKKVVNELQKRGEK